MSNQLFICDNIEEVGMRRESILAAVREGGYAVLRGLFDEVKSGESLRAIYRYANATPHRASMGVGPEEVRRNTSKWSIRGPSNGPARFALVIYNPLFDTDLFQMHRIFDRIVAARDTIAGREILRDSDLLPDRFNACRVQIYPAGGGFIAEHTDAKGESNLTNGPYIEMILLLTQNGIDYHAGGAFVTKEGSELNSERGTVKGDVIIYDASSLHGVRDVDSDLPFDANNLRGRAVALATVYRNP